MSRNIKYLPPRAEFVRLQLEGVIADSKCPIIKNGIVQYYEYNHIEMETPAGEEFLVF